MKITFDQLSTNLHKQLFPVYLITGQEPLFVQESVELIRKTLTQQGPIERIQYHVEPQFDWEQLQILQYSGSLFSEKQLVELRVGTQKINDRGKDLLIHYLAQPNQNNVLLITLDKIEGNQDAWLKPLEKIGLWVQIWPLQKPQWATWIQQRLKKQNLSATSDAANLLAELTMGNLLATAQEIEKLALLFPSGHQLSAQEIFSACAQNSRYNPFELLDYALNGNSKMVYRALQLLQQENTEPVLLLWLLTKELRTLAAIAQEASAHASLPQLLIKYKVWEKRKPILTAALKRHQPIVFLKFIQQASYIDTLIKGANIGNVWIEMEKLLLHLSGCKIRELNENIKTFI